MRTAIIGANGQLGVDLARAFSTSGAEVFPLTHDDIEIASADSVAGTLRALQPDLIINTAAMHHVERCEAEPDGAYRANAEGAGNVAAVANELGAVIIHVSTDYVFDGGKLTPYVEDDSPRPLNAYGESKLAGERLVMRNAVRHFVVRTSALFGHHPCRAKGGLNFVERMLKVGHEKGSVRVVADEIVTPTYTEELARQLAALARTDAYGLYHATAEGCCSWFEFAKAIFQMTGNGVRVEAADPGEFPMKTPRPKYSVLENAALKRIALNEFQPWQAGLKSYLNGSVVA